MLARGLGKINYFTEGQTRELLDLKTRLGFDDPRLDPEMRNCDICANDVFRDGWKEVGVERHAFELPPPMRGTRDNRTNGSNARATKDQEVLIQAITDRVAEALSRSKN